MPTPFVTYWKQQQILLKRQNRQAAYHARRDLERITQLLRKRYKAQRVVLFGSLAKGEFTTRSDIDLAVAGLAPADFFSALADTNQLSQFKVDLKPLEKLHPHLYRRVMSQGEILYEASDSG